MNPLRSALYAGILYTLALLVWLLGGLYGLDATPPVHVLFGEGFAVLVLTQALAAALFVPALAIRTPFAESLTAATLLLVVPWPLLALFQLASNIGLPMIAASQAALLLWALLLLVAARIQVPRLESVTASLVQLAGLALALTASGPWFDWSLLP